MVYLKQHILVKSAVAVSLLACGLILFLVYGREPSEATGELFAFLPTFNAGMNLASTFFLVLGFCAVRQGRIAVHKRWMLCALMSSSLFLVGYLAHHALHGDTPFLGVGWIRLVYFCILISHIVLSVMALPLVLITVGLALTERFVVHKKIARWTFPIWMYVSVTGVVVYLFLRG